MPALPKALTFIEMFRGIGGFRLGLESVGWRCVWSNDMSEHANKAYYSKNGWNTENDRSGKIETIDTATIPAHTLLAAGFPCQAFSLLGEREGFNDDDGNLYLEICRVVRAKRPTLLLLENVKGLLNHDEGHTAKRIFAALDELGYLLEWQVLNSKYFGVPQSRPRVFVVGHLRNQCSRTIFPIGCQSTTNEGTLGGERSTRSRVRCDLIRCLDAGYTKRRNSSETYVIENNRVRQLTELEFERAQGFPDNWTEPITNRIARYEAIGNAVTVNVIQVLGLLLADCLNTTTPLTGVPETTLKGAF